MEKQSFYEKLKKAKTYVKEYFDTKKIVDMTEFGYIREKYPEIKNIFVTSNVNDKEVTDSKKMQKILTVIFGIALIWGIGCVISGVVTAMDTAGEFGTFDIVLGIAIAVGSVLLFSHFNKKHKETMRVYQEKVSEENTYNKKIEDAKAEYRAIAESLSSKQEAMKEKLKELGIDSIYGHFHSYADFNKIIKYAEEHPKQTTPSMYLQKARKEEKEAEERFYRILQKEIDNRDNYQKSGDIYRDALAEDREARFHHDLEMQRREESRQDSLRWQEERRAWDEKKKQEARERTEHRAQVRREINERAAEERNLRHQCNTCSLSSKCYMRGSYPCPTYRPR